MQGIHHDLSLRCQNRVIAISQPWIGALCPSGWYGSAKHSIDLCPLGHWVALPAAELSLAYRIQNNFLLESPYHTIMANSYGSSHSISGASRVTPLSLDTE
jgi:hypothetical protein